jgi:hypothetical protein
VSLKLKHGQTTIFIVLALMLLLGTVFLSLRGLINLSLNSQATRRQRTHWEMFIDVIRAQLVDPVYCTAALEKQEIWLGKNRKSPISIKINYANTFGPIGPGFIDHTKQIKVKDVQLEILSSSRSRYVRLASPMAGLNSVWRAQIVFTSAATNSPENLDKPYYKIKLFVTLKPPGGSSATSGKASIVNCYGSKSEATACEELGGAFDANAVALIKDVQGEALRCHPYRNCFYGDGGIVYDPKLCDPPNGPGKPYSAKKISNLNGQNSYLCDWCNPNIPSGGDPFP